jgi:hypothetical protein
MYNYMIHSFSSGAGPTLKNAVVVKQLLSHMEFG